jgi:DNA invertase Pin-like site-specific DNA recombinase
MEAAVRGSEVPTGSNTNRPGLREALAARRNGDTFMVTKLDRLAALSGTRIRSRTTSQRAG